MAVGGALLIAAPLLLTLQFASMSNRPGETYEIAVKSSLHPLHLAQLGVADLFVTKLDYGAKLPFTHLRLPGLRQPRRGDIIVFQWPPDPTQDFIKRCIATGGQTVEVQHKQVSVDGHPLVEPYARHTQPDDQPAGTSPRDNFPPHTVPGGHLFMMGDNRENSADSRYWGYVPMDLVKGRALFIYFSTASQHWWDMPFYVRWERLFRLIR